MAGEVFIADKATLDRVNQTVTDVNRKIDTIESHMYTNPIKTIYMNTYSKQYYGFKDYLNITGSGYLIDAYISNKNNSSSYEGYGSIRITIDGVVILEVLDVKLHNYYAGIGIINTLCRYHDGDMSYVPGHTSPLLFIGGNSIELPYLEKIDILTESRYYYMHNKGIKFNKSCKVEIRLGYENIWLSSGITYTLE
ncbi:hypothetical protein [Clostridium sp.]|uniref:hypothetical protein n=1 Tax=Clostridium sp. TaxID=1506 RepID=UPI003464DA4B